MKQVISPVSKINTNTDTPGGGYLRRLGFHLLREDSRVQHYRGKEVN